MMMMMIGSVSLLEESSIPGSTYCLFNVKIYLFIILQCVYLIIILIVPLQSFLEETQWRCGLYARLRDHTMRVRIRDALLRSLSENYSKEKHGPLIPPNYGLNSTTTALPQDSFNIK